MLYFAVTIHGGMVERGMRLLIQSYLYLIFMYVDHRFYEPTDWLTFFCIIERSNIPAYRVKFEGQNIAQYLAFEAINWSISIPNDKWYKNIYYRID